MGHGHFDELTRSVASGERPRRAVLLLLAGGALGLLAARYAADGGVGAKPRHTRQRQRQAVKRRGQGAVETEGKRKKKRKKTPKPLLCSLFCEEDGGRCCPGVGCVFDEQCCPGEKVCEDGSCVGLRQCCPGDVPCRDGSCPAPGNCCPEKRQCADGSCVAEGICCPNEKRCIDGGSCYSADSCCPNALRPPCSSQCGDLVCEEGEFVCRPRQNGASCGAGGLTCCRGICYSTGCGEGRHFNPDNCRCECDEVFTCPPGQGFSHSTCSCVCNCIGQCCLSGCCTDPGGGNARCCQGY